MFRTFTVVVAFVSTISAAQAGDVIAVHYGDLNLTTANDTGTLAGRVSAVAELRCAALKPDPSYQSLFYKSGYKSCVERVSNATSAKVMAVAGEPRRFASR